MAISIPSYAASKHMRTSSKNRLSPAVKMRLAALPFLFLGVSLGWLLSLVFPVRSSTTGVIPAAPTTATRATAGVQPVQTGHVHSAFSAQGLSHVGFHANSFKLRLASLVKKTGRVAIVGVEHGVEVIALAAAGYEVHAFEPLSRFFNALQEKASQNARTWKVKMYHVAAGSTSGTKISLKYINTPEREEVTTARVDDHITGEIDVLSVDIQGNEYDVLKGATKILNTDNNQGIRSLWIEIFPCNSRVKQIFDLLKERYIIFDFVPWGQWRTENRATEGGPLPMTARMMSKRPSQHDEYLSWFCKERRNYRWMQSDIVAVRKDLVTPEFLEKLATIPNDAFVDSLQEFYRERKTLKLRLKRKQKAQIAAAGGRS